MIINIINNGWAISTPQSFADCGTTFAARAHGYNLPGLRVDGNDPLAVYAAERWAADRARSNGGPTLIEHFTYRAEGHSTSDDPTKYVPKEVFAEWEKKDPVERFRRFLEKRGLWSQKLEDEMRKDTLAEIDAAAQAAQAVIESMSRS